MILWSLFLSLSVAWVTFLAIKKPRVSPTRASSAVSLFCFGLLYLLSSFVYFELSYYSLLVFGASFVGMCSHKVFNDLEVVAASLVFALIYTYLSPKNINVGGLLGFSAFTSLSLVWCAARFSSAFKTVLTR